LTVIFRHGIVSPTKETAPCFKPPTPSATTRPTPPSAPTPSAAAVYLTEAAFEEYGWPADSLDESWLDDAGRATWEIFTAWRKA